MTEEERRGAVSTPEEGIAIVVLTYGRLHLLRQCIENVLSRTSAATCEIVIWDNGSRDGTSDYLDSLEDPRLTIVHHPKNIGQSAYRDAFPLTQAPFLIELDDDMVDAPENWDLILLEAFQRLPDIGFLASGLIDDPNDLSAYAMHHVHEYEEVEEHGLRLLIGPTGGGCAITSRELSDRVGGFRRMRRKVFFSEDGAYIEDIERVGQRAAVLPDLKLLHAGGPHYSQQPREKVKFWRAYQRRAARRRAVKRVLLRILGVAALNAKHVWFQPPVEEERLW